MPTLVEAQSYKPILGPDRGGDPEKFTGGTLNPPKVRHLDMGFMTVRREPGVIAVGPDRGGDANEFLPKAHAAGMEVRLPKISSDDTSGILYIDSEIFKEQDLPPIPRNGHDTDLEIHVGEVKLGLSGREERMVLLSGNIRSIFDYSRKFRIVGKSVTLKADEDITVTTHQQALERLEALQAA